MSTKIKHPVYFPKTLFISLFLLVFVSVSAQDNPGGEVKEKEVKKYLREAESALEKEDFATAETYYRRAIAKDPGNAVARYNLGNLYYNNNIPTEAVDRHSQAADVAEEKPVKHNSFHNQGNAYMKQKKYSEAVEAYKNSLRNDPSDDETRYNLALAKKMLEKEQQGGGGDDSQDENQEQQDQNKDQEGEGEQEEESDQGEEKEQQEGGDKDSNDRKEGDEEQDEEGKPQKDEEQDDKGGKEDQQDPRQQQPVPGQLSPEQVKSLLEAMGNEEKKVQDKMNAEKAKGSKVKSEKDW